MQRNPTTSKHRWRRIITLLVFAGCGINLLAWRQARSMLHYSDIAAPQIPIEQMSVGQKLRTVLFGVAVARPTNHATPANLGLAYKTIQLATPRGELELWRIDVDQPRGTLVLFHGYAGSKESLLPQAQIIQQLGWRIVLVDFYGSGGSDGATTTLGMREADDVRAVLHYVDQQFGAEPVVAYGFSMGAAAITQANLDTPLPVDGIIVEALFDRLINTTRQRFKSMGLPAFPAAELLLFWGGVDAHINGFALNPVDAVRSITVPLLILRGEHDPRVSAAATNAIRANAPNASLNTLSNTAHESGAATQPDQWRDDVQAFLASIKP